jgi:excinuclease ABC subunit C
MFDFVEALKNLPDHPGVYIMKNLDDEIIYIGKAISLKNRVRQYFQSSKNHAPKVIAMVKNIAYFEYILADSELEALILECNLIKKHKPRYNILLKDDKHYPYIKVTLSEEYPKVMIVRKILKDNSKYFGPYTDVSAVNEIMTLIKKIYPLRTCKREVDFGKHNGRPCLNFFIKRCLAPCQGNIDKEAYKDMIKSIISFLSGKDEEITTGLKIKMEEASDKLDFEKAAEFRDQINSIKILKEKQRAITTALADEDVIAFTKSDDGSCVEVFFIREGKLLGRENYYFDDIEESNDELLSQFIMQFYMNREYIPKEILLQNEISELNILEDFLTSKKGSKVQIKVPKRGDKTELIDMARKNAEAALEQLKYKTLSLQQSTVIALEELQMIIGLEKLPKRIEAFDISNIQGTDPVGSMVVYEDGKPKNKDYRRFRIKTINQPDDYGSMKEVLRRRFSRGLKEIVENKENNDNEGKFSVFPDLILMDGGLGQVNIAEKVLSELELDITVCGMVKDDRHRTRGLIYKGDEISIHKDTNAFKLITRIQDEAHRVAITYHRSLRGKGSIASLLDEIDGIGPKRRLALLNGFQSIEDIKNATVEELQAVKGMNITAATKVYEYFHVESKKI